MNNTAEGYLNTKKLLKLSFMIKIPIKKWKLIKSILTWLNSSEIQRTVINQSIINQSIINQSIRVLGTSYLARYNAQDELTKSGRRYGLIALWQVP